jgi:hypothetical protein
LLAIQSAIDIALHVVAECSPETPETYGSAFAQLGDQTSVGPFVRGRAPGSAPREGGRPVAARYGLGRRT